MSEKTNIEKAKEEVLKGAPKIRGYTLKEIEKLAHVGPTCPKTGNPYKGIMGHYERWYYGPLSGGGGCRVTCSECGELLYYTIGIRF